MPHETATDNHERELVHFTYTNHKGVTEQRKVLPLTLKYHSKPMPEYGYQPGVFLHGICSDRNALRTFDVTRMLPPEGAGVNAAGMFTLFDIERARNEDTTFWAQEASDWALAYAHLRQIVEAQQDAMYVHVKGARNIAALGYCFLFIAIFVSYANIVGWF